MFAFTIKNKPTIFDLSNGGYANGYVAIPKNHCLYGTDYMDINLTVNINVHSGLTFSNEMTVKEIDSLADKIVAGDTNTLKPEDTFWVLGFDTRHFNDNLENCPKSYCEQETLNLYNQIKG